MSESRQTENELIRLQTDFDRRQSSCPPEDASEIEYLQSMRELANEAFIAYRDKPNEKEESKIVELIKNLEALHAATKISKEELLKGWGGDDYIKKLESINPAQQEHGDPQKFLERARELSVGAVDLAKTTMSAIKDNNENKRGNYYAMQEVTALSKCITSTTAFIQNPPHPNKTLELAKNADRAAEVFKDNKAKNIFFKSMVTLVVAAVVVTGVMTGGIVAAVVVAGFTAVCAAGVNAVADAARAEKHQHANAKIEHKVSDFSKLCMESAKCMSAVNNTCKGMKKTAPVSIEKKETEPESRSAMRRP